MPIFQPVDLVIGVVLFPLGLFGLGQDLRRVSTRTFQNRYAYWRSLTLSVWFLSAGAAHFSKAFDPRHHESPTTSLLETIEVSSISVLLLASGIAWVVGRRGADGPQ